MTIAVLKCPNCGAPIPPDAGATHQCTYCLHVLRDVPLRGADAWRGRPEDEGRPRVTAAGQRYVVLGRLASGDSCDVFFARRDARLTELAVLKVLRALADADLLAREWAVLQTLHGTAATGAEHFTRLLPQLVARGTLADAGTPPRPVSVYRWRSGFVHTFDDVARAHPGGVDPRAAVWLWKRTLELLGWVHGTGHVHGAVLPRHLLVHARDHGVVLVGWSAAVRAGQALPATCANARAAYPDDVWAGGPATRATDIAMSARCVVRVLGGDPAAGRVPSGVPWPLADLLATWLAAGSSAPGADAWAVKAQLDHAACEVFGPPRYVPLALPGWVAGGHGR